MIIALGRRPRDMRGMGFSIPGVDSLVGAVSDVLTIPTKLVSATTSKTISAVKPVASQVGGLVNSATDFGNNLASKIMNGLRSLKGGGAAGAGPLPAGTTVNAAGQLIGPNGLPISPASSFPWGLVLGGVVVVGLGIVLLRRRSAAPAAVAS